MKKLNPLNILAPAVALLAFKNIFRNRIRTLLTVLGAAVGIAIYVSLTNVSDNFKRQLIDMTDGSRVDLVIQSADAGTPLGSRISDELVQEIDSLDEVLKSVQVVLHRLRVPWNPFLMVIGFSSMELIPNNIRLLEGRYPEAGTNEILIGVEIARMGYQPGQNIILQRDTMYRVAGVYSSEVKLANGSVVMHLDSARKMAEARDYVNMVFVQLRENVSLSDAQKIFEQNFRGLYAAPTGALADNILLTNVVESSVKIIAMLAIIGACVVVANTLMMSVTERTREIGTLMAIGWSNLMILRLILFESILISLAALILGCATAYSVLWLISTVNLEGVGWWITPVPSTEIIVNAILISLALGIVGGALPAYTATKLNPADALRYE